MAPITVPFIQSDCTVKSQSNSEKNKSISQLPIQHQKVRSLSLAKGWWGAAPVWSSGSEKGELADDRLESGGSAGQTWAQTWISNLPRPAARDPHSLLMLCRLCLQMNESKWNYSRFGQNYCLSANCQVSTPSLKIHWFQLLYFPTFVSIVLNIAIYRVFFLTGPTQKSSKYGTGPPQYRKMTKFTGDGKNPLLKKWKSMSESVRPSLFAVS